MERDFVDWLRGTLPPHPLLRLGVGDDAALLSLGGAADVVVTTDLLADGTPFLVEEVGAELGGRTCWAAHLGGGAARAA
ncbi:MAG: thiamine-monophosphate kinase, partial [Planctomycetota bacterium]